MDGVSMESGAGGSFGDERIEDVIRHFRGDDHPILLAERKKREQSLGDNQDFECGEAKNIELTDANHASDWYCLNPVCRDSDGENSGSKRQREITTGKSKLIVGVKKAPRINNNGDTWAAIWKCGDCHTAYWAHVDEEFARIIKKRQFNQLAVEAN